MSSLIHVKGIILTHMTASPELKEAVMDVINAIDDDLDQIAYDEDNKSEATISAIKALDAVLSEAPEPVAEDNPIISNRSLLEEDDSQTNE